MSFLAEEKLMLALNWTQLHQTLQSLALQKNIKSFS
jgi:hypothetical protein